MRDRSGLTAAAPGRFVPRRAALLALAFALLAGPAAAFRGVAAGTEYARAAQIEAGLGSERVGDPAARPDGDYSLLFRGRSHEHDATISYACRSGRVDTQLVTIEVASEQEGHALFSDWQRELTSELGPPSKDLDEPAVGQLQESLEHPIRRFAVWTAGGRSVTVVLWGGAAGTWELVASGP